MLTSCQRRGYLYGAISVHNSLADLRQGGTAAPAASSRCLYNGSAKTLIETKNEVPGLPIPLAATRPHVNVIIVRFRRAITRRRRFARGQKHASERRRTGALPLDRARLFAFPAVVCRAFE